MMAGPMRDADRQRFMEDVERMGLAGRVVVPGYVSDEDVAPRYSAAAAFLLSSTL